MRSTGTGHDAATDNGATRVVASTFGVLAGAAGVEHGIGEILQGPVEPGGLVVESWPGSTAFEVLGGEPALTVIPDLLVTGIAAVIVAMAIVAWSARYIDRRPGGPVLIMLSLLLLVVGGGFGPALIGIIVGVGATRIGVVPRRPPGRTARVVARAWRWILAVAVLGYLLLLPGTLLLGRVPGLDGPGLVLALTAFSFAGLVSALVAARAEDRRRAGVE